MKKSSNVVDILRVSFYYWRLYYIFPFTWKRINDETVLIFSPVIFSINIIAMTIITSLEIYVTIPSINFIIDIIKKVDPLLVFIFVVYFVTAVTCANLFCQRLKAVFDDLLSLDNMLKEICVDPNDKSTVIFTNLLICIEITSILMYYTLTVIEGGISLDFVTFLFRGFLSNIRITILMQFSTLLFILYNRFRLINRQLIICKSLYSDSPALLKKDLLKSVQTCFDLHCRLCIIANKLNRAFDYHLTATIVSTFWYSITTLHFIIIWTPPVDTVFLNTYYNVFKTTIHVCVVYMVTALGSMIRNAVSPAF